MIAASALPSGVNLTTLKETGWVKSPPAPPTFDTPLRLAEAVPLPTLAPEPDMLRLLTPKSHYFFKFKFCQSAPETQSAG